MAGRSRSGIRTWRWSSACWSPRPRPTASTRSGSCCSTPTAARWPARRAASSARGQRDGRDAVLTFSIDLWNLTFPAPGDYSFRILVNGSERKRLPLLITAPRMPDGRTRRRGCSGAARPARPPRVAAIDEAALLAARHADRLIDAARDVGVHPLGDVPRAVPDRLRDDEPARPARRGAPSPGGVRAEGLDPRLAPEDVTEPFLGAIDRLLKVIARHEARSDH